MPLHNASGKLEYKMDLYKAAKGAYKDQESTAMKALIVYKFIVTLLIAFPLLYIAGFSTGLDIEAARCPNSYPPPISTNLFPLVCVVACQSFT
jgi:hypothetical protein